VAWWGKGKKHKRQWVQSDASVPGRKRKKKQTKVAQNVGPFGGRKGKPRRVGRQEMWAREKKRKVDRDIQKQQKKPEGKGGKKEKKRGGAALPKIERRGQKSMAQRGEQPPKVGEYEQTTKKIFHPKGKRTSGGEGIAKRTEKNQRGQEKGPSGTTETQVSVLLIRGRGG